jgi:nucleotide-binding universal stress UspA family protein
MTLSVCLLLLVAFAGGTLVACWLAWWSGRAAWRTLRLWRAVRSARADGFGDLAPGAVALRGTVVPIDPIVSEETGRRGVYLAYAVDRWQRGATIGGVSGQWMRAEDDAEAAPFELTDGVASVLVEPAQAKVLHVRPLTVEVPERDGSPMRYHETMIEEGAEVVVVGHATARGGFDPSTAYRGHTLRTVVAAGEGELVIAPCGLARSLLARGLLQVVVVLPAPAMLLYTAAFVSKHLLLLRALVF